MYSRSDNFEIIIKRFYSHINFSKEALDSLIRYDRSRIYSNEEATEDEDLVIYSNFIEIVSNYSMAPIRDRVLLDASDCLVLAPENIKKQAIEIGEMSIYWPHRQEERQLLIQFNSAVSEKYTTDIVMNSEGKIFVFDENLDNVYLAADNLASFLPIKPTEHYYRSYILSFPWQD